VVGVLGIFRRRPKDPLEALIDLAVELETLLVKLDWGLARPAAPDARERLLELEEEAFEAFEEGRFEPAYADRVRARASQLLART
jgi:hypothetical protein